MKIGSVVLYKGQVALVTEISDGKILIEGEDETLSKRVREKDVCVLSETPVTSLEAVLQAELDPVDFSVASEFFNDTASFNEVAELFYAKLRPEQMWKAWLAISESPYFEVAVPTAPIIVRSSDDVAKLKEKAAEKNREAELYTECIAEIKKALSTTQQNGTTDCLINKSRFSKFLQEVEQLAYGKVQKSKLLVDLKIKQSPEHAHELLLKLKVWTAEKNPYPQRFEVLSNDAKAAIAEPLHEKPCVDLTHLVSYAIDNPGSTDPDDAICFDGRTLYIHVACPAETVKQGTEADDAACDRGSTLYLPEQIGRMLNENATKYFALGLERECYALTFALNFDQSFEPSDVRIFRSKISVERMTYEQAELKKDGELKPLFELTRRLYARRVKNGAVTIKMPEVSIVASKAANGEESTIEIEPLKTFESSEMIREMMLLAGEAGAMFAFKHQIPFQYISQDEPTLPAKLADGLAGEYQKRKSMHARVLSTVPSKHFALGLSMYAQLTSPLRRYADLLSQQQILCFLDNERLIDRDTFLARLSRTDIGVRNINKVARLSRTHWILVYLQKKQNRTFEAVILEASGNKVHCIIPEIAFEMDMHLKTPRQLNDTLKVKAQDINLAFQSVVFVEVDA